MRTKEASVFKLLASLVICVGGGWLSGLFTNAGQKDWYRDLIKSGLTPPDYVFPLAWTILYILMAVALYLVWIGAGKNKSRAIFFFGLQLFFNFIWSFIFFYQENVELALIDIGCLWFAILTTMALSLTISKPAFYLLIPYLGWVSFAFYLNFFIWIKN